ncbi:MAG: protein kinase, partial [Kiritimatiellae bacterium]|nr:protein kinase [Kiritimatiellia bacterium]
PPAVHRDVKPGNVLFEPDGRAVLADFGIASRLHGAEDADGSVDTFGAGAREGFVGTADYAAPEQRRGAPPAPAMDWYSLGAVLFEALTGERPRGPELPSEYDPRRISRRWDPLLKGMLAARPERRLADGPAIVAALRALQFSRRDRALQWGVAVLHAFAALAFLLGMILWIVSKKLLS